MTNILTVHVMLPSKTDTHKQYYTGLQRAVHFLKQPLPYRSIALFIPVSQKRAERKTVSVPSSVPAGIAVIRGLCLIHGLVRHAYQLLGTQTLIF